MTIGIRAALLLAGALLGAVAAGPARAQASLEVRGVVRSDATGEGVPSAEVTVRDARGGRVATVYADAGGVFAARARGAGPYAVDVRRIGYEPEHRTGVGAVAATEVGVEIRMRPVAQALARVEIDARMARVRGLMEGFERRRRMKLGTFFTREDIERRGYPTLTDLLRSANGVRVVGNGGRSSVIKMDRAASFHACQPVLYVDGVRTTHYNDPPDKLEFMLESLGAQTLEALEVYSGQSQVPADFGGPEAQCGAIAAWTRTPPSRPDAPKPAPPDSR